MKVLSCLILTFFCFLSSFAAQVDTLSVFSSRMNKTIKNVVIRPEGKIPQSTLYLLHGYSGNYSDWVNRVADLKKLVDQYGYLVVCPDGGFDSWYWDTADSNYQYESYIIEELIPFVEKNFAVKADREHRAITGLSMGGHGALSLAIRHQAVFAYAGSTSGGVDIRPFPANWSLEKHLGSYAEHPAVWDNHTVLEMTNRIKPNALKLFIDCGTSDFFYAVNCKLHEKLTYMNVPHTFLTMPGKHDWAYWSTSIAYQMAFFNTCFTSTN